jgi:hypothetical protein
MPGKAAIVGHGEWRRVFGFRVVVSWPETGLAPPPRRRRTGWRARLAGVAGFLLFGFGVVTIGVVLASQLHAPQPPASAAGSAGSAPGGRLTVSRSVPVSVSIPAIGVSSRLLRLGNNPDGSMQVPSLRTSASMAAWYKYSATPGQPGASVIEGHVDGYNGPAVFFRLGALRPGEEVFVTLADGATAAFRVTGVRQYLKSAYPARLVYAAHGYAALRLITCGGEFDPATGHYLSSVVVFASLVSMRR